MSSVLLSEIKIPLEIFLNLFELVDSYNDLLALALTCKTFCRIIIPNHLHYFRIRTGLTDDWRWDDFLQQRHKYEYVREIELIENGQYEEPILGSNLRHVLKSLVGLRRARVSIVRSGRDVLNVFRHVFDALVDSRCCLKELDITFIPNYRRPPRFICGTGLLYSPPSPRHWSKTNLKELPILSKLNLTSLRKLSLQLGVNESRGNHSLIEGDHIVDIISNATGLTHLQLDFVSEVVVSLPSLFDCTWPNLENFTISNVTYLRDTDRHPRMSPNFKLTEFFRRHPQLRIVSIPYDANSPLITVTDLPQLESFSNDAPVQIPLGKLITPTLARTLRHLTVGEKDSVLLPAERDIYKELVSLKTCCITSESHYSSYQGVNRILENFVAHVINLEKIHLPAFSGWGYNNSDLEGCFEALSFLQCLPNLTHLSGIGRINDLFPETEEPYSERMVRELDSFPRLRYIIPVPTHATRGGVGDDSSVFRLDRDKRTGCVLYEPVLDPVTIRECQAALWGGFRVGRLFVVPE